MLHVKIVGIMLFALKSHWHCISQAGGSCDCVDTDLLL